MYESSFLWIHTQNRSSSVRENISLFIKKMKEQKDKKKNDLKQTKLIVAQHEAWEAEGRGVSMAIQDGAHTLSSLYGKISGKTESMFERSVNKFED